MKIGFLFPGQGTQYVGMGKDLYDNYKGVQEIYNKVCQITNIDIKGISFDGCNETLNKTENTQLAILTQSLATLRILKDYKIESEISLGLSLGEYTALIDDNILSFEDGVKLVKTRGEIMQDLTPKGCYKMCAILGLDSKKVEQAVSKVTKGFCSISNYNTIGQTVISGDEEAVIEASEYAKELGAKKVSILNTSGPFHTEKLERCASELKSEIEKIKINKKECKVIKNIDGQMYDFSKDNIAEILSKHIMNPVQFVKGMQTMYESNVDTFIEVGPGKTLSSFVKRMKFEKEISIFNVNSVETLNNLINSLNKNNKI